MLQTFLQLYFNQFFFLITAISVYFFPSRKALRKKKGWKRKSIAFLLRGRRRKGKRKKTENHNYQLQGTEQWSTSLRRISRSQIQSTSSAELLSWEKNLRSWDIKHIFHTTKRILKAVSYSWETQKRSSWHLPLFTISLCLCPNPTQQKWTLFTMAPGDNDNICGLQSSDQTELTGWSCGHRLIGLQERNTQTQRNPWGHVWL